MKEFEYLTTDSALYGMQLEKQNRNNKKLVNAINTLIAQTQHFRGYFNSLSSLNKYAQDKVSGDFAYVGKDLYYVESLKWVKSGYTIDDINFGRFSLPYVDEQLETYYRGDSILVVIGTFDEFSDNYNIKANIFVSKANIIKASIIPEEGNLQIRKDTVNNKYYFVIPQEVSASAELGTYTLEVAAYFTSLYEGEDFVKRRRKEVFDLYEFETI